GIAWWILGWFAVMPSPLRDAPWAAVRDPALFQLAVAGLLACLSYGAALGGAFTLFGRAGGRQKRRASSSGARRGSVQWRIEPGQASVSATRRRARWIRHARGGPRERAPPDRRRARRPVGNRP